MKSDSNQFSQANILYGSGDSQKQASIDVYCDAQSARFRHVFGEQKGIGIDTVHEIRRRALIAAGSGIQVFILWRVDEMTHEAMQALLKLLEEPPQGAIFFLCTRTLFLPATIISRTSRFAFFGESESVVESSDAAQLFADKIIELKAKLEQEIIEQKSFSRALVYRLETLIRLSSALTSTRISPKYLMDSFNILA
ncbi:MAG: hypothetical protein AAB482_04715 [Patescibacteria group bacterium]